MAVLSESGKKITLFDGVFSLDCQSQRGLDVIRDFVTSKEAIAVGFKGQISAVEETMGGFAYQVGMALHNTLSHDT